MLTIEKTVTVSPEQMEIIIEGMRNPMNSWDKSDSRIQTFMDNPEEFIPSRFEAFYLGDADHKLMDTLIDGGPVHAKFRRMIPVWVTVNAPLYWWKEFETYRIGVAENPSDIEFNSCSTMHKIHSKEFTLDDFSCEHLINNEDLTLYGGEWLTPLDILKLDICTLNGARKAYFATNEKKYWRQLIQLLPTSYNQKRTIFMNYQALAGIYKWRRNHKLDEWHVLCDWIEKLPHSELITRGE